MTLHFADVWEAIARALPDAPAVVQGDRAVNWQEYEDRAARFAGVLAAHGVGRDAKVGLYLYNCPEYLEAQFGAFKARAVPINVNYRYGGDELVYLLDNADAEMLVYHSSLAGPVRDIAGRLPKVRAFIEVDDRGSQAGPGPVVENALQYEQVLASAEPAAPVARSDDDTYMLYTGGTTGLPKGVMYSIGDVAASFLLTASGLYGVEPVTEIEQAVAAATAMREGGRSPVTYAAPPLMHGAGMWMGVITPHLFGAPVVLAANRSFDGEAFIHTVAQHKVTTAVIVGDAYARPIVDALDRLSASGAAPDLSSVKFIASSGAMLSDQVKSKLLEHIPGALVADMLGSSEGAMGAKIAFKGQDPTTAKFDLNPGVKVLREDGTEVEPGSGEVGTVAVAGRMVPRGYYKDPERSERTFRTIDGIRYSFPGDMATVEADGSVRLLGRGNGCINTGGEKVYPEEVEEALKKHPGVVDSLVLGVDDERFGQRVVAVVQCVPGADAEDEDIVSVVRQHLAGYKIPREIRRVDIVPRTPTGKPDYTTARQLFTEEKVAG